MARYKLTYFPIRGRGECIRMVFAAAGVEFENVRLNPEEWFTKLKQCEYQNSCVLGGSFGNQKEIKGFTGVGMVVFSCVKVNGNVR